MIDQGSFSVMSLNVRGLRNHVKRRSIFRFLKDQNYLFYFLQETYSKPGDEIIWKSEWGGDIFFSHGSTHSRILINPLHGQTVNNLNKDENGRMGLLQLAVTWYMLEGKLPTGTSKTKKIQIYLDEVVLIWMSQWAACPPACTM